MDVLAPTDPPGRRSPPRHRVQRAKARARYDEASVHAILDAGMLAHVAFAAGGQPFVIPMLYAREGNALLLHGSIASRLVGALAGGVPACACVTHLDGLVLARSHFNHSANYRSVVVFGRAVPVDDIDEKAAALVRLVNALVPGRAAESRAANRKELAATRVLRLVIEDASAKVRSGGANDDAADLALPHWAGVVPLSPLFGAAEPDTALAPEVALPGSVGALQARAGTRP